MISINKVSKSFKRGNTNLKILQNISLEIKTGEFIAIVGKSGSGKSTLLNIIGGIESPSSGTIKINNVETNKLSNKARAQFRNQEIGFIFQDFLLHPYLTVKENIALPLTFSNKKHQNLKQTIAEIGLTHRQRHLPNQLSGGEQQRTAIGRAIINSPSIILADEPTGNLDSKTGKQIIKVLMNLHQELQNTMIIVTHDPQVAKHANRTITIQDGQIKQTQ